MRALRGVGLALAAIAGWTLLVPAAGHAHTGERIVVALDGLSPPQDGVRVELQPGAGRGRLTVSVPEGHRLQLRGVHGEAFVTIGPDVVLINDASPTASVATKPEAPPPPELPPGIENVPPKWRQVSSRPQWSWYDPRAVVPEGLRTSAHPADDGALMRWTIPGTYDDTPVTIEGRVEVIPPPVVDPEATALAAISAIGLGSWVARRRERIARATALLAGSGVILEGWLAVSAGGAALATIAGLVLVAAAVPLVWNDDPAGVRVAAAFGLYLTAMSAARWIVDPPGVLAVSLAAVAGGVALTVGAGRLLFGNRRAVAGPTPARPTG